MTAQNEMTEYDNGVIDRTPLWTLFLDMYENSVNKKCKVTILFHKYYPGQKVMRLTNKTHTTCLSHPNLLCLLQSNPLPPKFTYFNVFPVFETFSGIAFTAVNVVPYMASIDSN